MAFTYETAVPWGRSFEEYVRMFALSDSDLRKRVLACADGPASFNAGMAARGGSIVSCDPLYQFSTTQIRTRIEETYPNVIGQTYANRDCFVWESIASVEELGRVRLGAMHGFLADFDQGKRGGRYVAAELPHLPFAASSFDLAVCSHFLFMYSPILSLAFHQSAVESLCAVAEEVRIFPLLTYDANLSPHVEPVVEALRKAGRRVSIEAVPYEFQRGGNKMMRVSS